MKRKAFLALTIIAFSAFSAFGLFACIGDGGKTTPTKPAAMLAPYVVSLGNFLYWDEVDGADRYTVYADEKRVAETAENKYYFDGAGEYYVVAENSAFGAQSKKSNAVTVFDYDITDDKTLYCEEDDWWQDGVIPISEDCDKVVVSGYYPFTFVIGERTRDLIFELTDATIVGGIITSDGSYSRFKHNYSVIFEISGTCSVTGDTGKSGTSYDAFDDSELNGLKGGDGCDAVLVPSLVVRGSGSLELSGGDGGRGGNGASATAWSGKHSGMGGSGGNGGAAIKTSFFVLELAESDTVTLNNGGGGSKGNRGDNADIGTGFDEWFFGAQDGVDGIAGESRTGREIIFGGTVNGN